MILPEDQLSLMCRIGLRRAAIRRLPGLIKEGQFRPGRPTLLCLSRSHFARDLAELRKRTDLNYLDLRSKYVSRCQDGLVNWDRIPIRLHQTFYQSTLHPEALAARKRTEEVGRQILAALRKRYPIDGVMSANTDYWAEDAIQVACREAGIPFLVLSKEHYVSGWLRANRVRDYTEAGFRFKGTAVALFGELTVPTLTETGVCRPDQVSVTGPPRFDPWREPAPAGLERDILLLFSFSKGYLVQDSYRDTLLAFARASMAATGPTPLFYVKCKNGEDREAAEMFLREVPGHSLKLTAGKSNVELLRRARLVIGFNSLALLEGLFTPARLVVPNWGDANRDPFDLMLNPREGAARAIFDFAESPEEMGRWIAEAVAAPAEGRGNPGERMAFLRRYFYFPEHTTCSAEVEAFVRKHLERSSG